jgi:hypothetical protein
VAGLAILALVRDMAEIKWLSLLRIEQIGKNDPADNQGADKAQQKENHPQCLVSGRSTFLLIHRAASVFPKMNEMIAPELCSLCILRAFPASDKVNSVSFDARVTLPDGATT